MGLLDDAIREHLELKRRRGADPGEIAHQERAALEPSAPRLPDAHAQVATEIAEDPNDEPTDAHEQHDQHATAVGEGEQPGLAEVAAPGQETAEFDMRAVMAEGPHEETHAASAEPLSAPHAHTGAPGEDEAMDWEFPGQEAREHHAEPTPGQERLSFE